MFKRVYLAFKGSRLWLAAIDSAKQRDYDESKKLLVKMESIGVHPNIEYCLLRGFIEYSTHQKQLASKFLNMAMGKLNKAKRFNQNEKLYLTAYAESILKEYDEEHEYTTLSDIDLASVSWHLKDKFPLIEHPYWKR
ncbi:hypothetical protein ACFOD1_06310 [Pseudidiomarina halophila]|uniref:Uncharacterized protein n=1 Tax=Pseudidiomarina halophila TaxID=1449799 RepID=A0A432XTT0_9GAMM|nr:hypothetical protein [Pseudidiomarina halophila]RUO52073.1 hypothetical protein CWI69_10580 [Pseudidiomarina halophila]